MRHKKLLLCVGSLSLSMITALPQYQANSLQSMQEQMQQLQTAAANASKQVASDKTQALALQSAVQRYTVSIQNVQKAEDSNHQQIQSLEKQMKQLDAEISQNQQLLQTDQNELTNLLRTQYESGSVSYMAVVFHATSFSDLLDRFSTLSLLSKHEHELEDQVLNLRKSLLTERANQSQTYSTLQKKQKEYELLISVDKTLQSQKKRAFTAASARLKNDNERHGMLESQLHLTQAQIQQIESETQSAEQLMNNSSYVQRAQQGLVQVNVSSLIHYAESFTGTPYVWGGTTPSGFDCSGFTQYVFRKFGVSLNRTSQAQFAQGVPVSQGNLQPGDLVFFSTYAPGATHVGIYIGGGLMVNSEDAGCMVTPLSNPYWAPRYIGARRVIK